MDTTFLSLSIDFASFFRLGKLRKNRINTEKTLLYNHHVMLSKSPPPTLLPSFVIL